MARKFRVFATCDIGESLELLRKRGYEVEVYPDPVAPPKQLILEKVKSGIDGLITTLRDPIDAEVFSRRIREPLDRATGQVESNAFAGRIAHGMRAIFAEIP